MGGSLSKYPYYRNPELRRVGSARAAKDRVLDTVNFDSKAYDWEIPDCRQADFGANPQKPTLRVY